MKPQILPNLITIFRLLLVIPIAISLLNENYHLAFYIFFIAGVSDGVDGYLARKFLWTSRFGAIVDPLADKVLMVVTYFCLTWLDKIPWWLFVVVVLRDIVLMLGVVLYNYFIERIDINPSRISKINTFLQILLVVSLLFDSAFMALPQMFKELLMFTVLITTASSFIDYLYDYINKACEVAKNK